jgi:hypothetical protein
MFQHHVLESLISEQTSEFGLICSLGSGDLRVSDEGLVCSAVGGDDGLD